MNPTEAYIPISMFIMIGLAVIAAIIVGYQKRRLESQEIIAAIEKGVEIQFPERKRNRLLPGLIWTLVGVVGALGMAFAVPEDAPAGTWIWGLVPVAIGISYLIVYYLEQKGKI